MSNISKRSILITGGASGIGRIMSRIVLEKKAGRLIIWDINQQNLDATIAALKPFNAEVYGLRVDLSKPADILQAAEETEKIVGEVHIIINNAGIVTGKLFNDHSYTEIEQTMLVNAQAPMMVSKAFLQQMIGKGRGHICTIASAAGMVSNPRMSVYCASKWAVIGWSDSLRLEMEQLKTGVKITTIVPYYISTGLFDGVRSLIPMIRPEDAAARIIRAIEKDRISYKMPWIINLLPLAKGILPIRLFDFLIGKGFGIYKSMSHFTGRTH